MPRSLSHSLSHSLSRFSWSSLVAPGARLALALALVFGLAPALAQEASPGALPDTARGPAVDPQKGYLVDEIADGLYWITEGSYQVIFLVTDEGVVVVDAPPTLGERIPQAIAEVTDQPITHVIYSHSHGDHIGAAGAIYPDDATIIAHEDTAAILERADDDALRPSPDVTFADAYTLELGGRTLELHYPGPNHEPGNIFIYAPEQKTLMLVDVVFPGWVPFAHLALAEDVPGFVEVHERALSFDFDTFVGGHLTRLGDRSDVETALAYVRDLQANGAEAIRTVDFMAVAQEVGFEDQWALFDAYLDAVAQACADATLAQWGERLGGAEAFTHSHCWTMTESLRVDWNLVGGASLD